MKIALFYFSGTGNTKKACEYYSAYMEERDNSVTLYPVESLKTCSQADLASIINNMDSIGLAYPVYGANLPKTVSDFVHHLPKTNHKKIFVLSTVGYINAYGPFIIKKQLHKLGYNMRWHYVYKTINNTKIRKTTTAMLEEKHNNQIKKFERFCNSIIDQKRFFNGIGPWIIGGYVVRKILHKPIANHYKSFYVDKDICIHCNMCVSNCPQNAILINNGSYTFTNACTTCLRCINACPVHAIKEMRT